MSELIKEWSGNGIVTHFTIREDNYDCSLEKIMRLVNAAKIDFPQLRNSHINVVIYHDDISNRQMGIEFNMGADAMIPAGYQNVKRLKKTFN